MLLTLPQETLNDIVAHLRGEERALQSLSLVHRRLTEECRSHLFSSVHIDSLIKLWRWCDTISPEKDGLSRYTRFLDLNLGKLLCTPASLEPHLVHLRAFSQVEHLGIRPFHLRRFPGQQLARYFGHFSAVRSVCIKMSGDPRNILDFLSLFPLLETTVIKSPFIQEREDNLDLPDHVCHGDLVLKVCKVDDRAELNILSCFTRPTTRYRKLGLGLVMVHNFAPLEQFLQTCGGSLESVQFISLLIPPWVRCPDDLLYPLTNLQNITLSLRFLNDHPNTLTILSSISSTQMKSVTFIIWECYYPDDLEDFCSRWMKIENVLCRLSELRKGSESGGEVVLNVHFDDERVANEVSGFAERKEFMPRFQEEGQVNVETQRMDLNRAMANMAPEQYSGLGEDLVGW